MNRKQESQSLPFKGASAKTQVSQTVYCRLHRDIVSGRLAPGTRLVHRELAAQTGTSTIPVIDALRQLEGTGLVVAVPGQGAEVRRWQPHEYVEAYLIRASQEGIACRLFAERATERDFIRLTEYNEHFKVAARRKDQEACDDADENFHLHIVKCARSVELSRLVENSGTIVRLIRNVFLPPALHVPGPIVGHDAIVRALRRRDPDAAEREGRGHVLESSGYSFCRQFYSELPSALRGEMD